MAAQTELNVIVKGKDELGPELNRLSSQVIRFVGAISASLAAIRIGSEPVVQAARYERELANVQKTTNFTRKEIGMLSDALLGMSKNVDISAKDLATISAAAGQMGLGRFGVQGVADFTDSVSRMASVLDLTAEEAGENIGKIINVFRIPLRNIESAVSSFNQVANNSTAKGQELLDVVRRIGDAAGALKLDQAIGLAATGLDFGISPEVVGTSLATMFARMRERADALGRLLKVSATDFINILQNDGVDALQRVMAELRTLQPQMQQEAITKLFGGGRISAFVNKMLQDTTNQVMNRNLQNATEGFRDGTSAIVEQATVLQSAQSQATMLLNTLNAISMKAVLGDMGTGSSMIADMAYAALQFREAINTPGIQSTFDAIYRSVGDMAVGISDAVKWVASLNVNWENLITLGKFWLSLKLAGWFGDLALRATGLNAALKGTADATKAMNASVVTGSAGAVAAQQQVAAASKTSWAAQKLGLGELEQAYRQYAQTALQQEQLIRQERQRTAALQKAQAAEDAANRGVARAQGAAQARGVDVTNESVKLQQLYQQRAKLEAAAEAGRAASIQRSMQNDAAIRLQIEQVYQNQLSQIKGRGAVAARAALQAEYENQMRQADAANARSLASVKQYWDRRKATDVAGMQASIQAQQAALIAAQSKFDKAFENLGNRKGAASTVAEGTKLAADALAATTAAMAPAAARVGIFTRAVNLATLTFRGMVGFVSAAGGLLMRAFGWIGLIYTIADAFGLVDKLGGAFSVLAEKIGLVSRAERDRNIQAENTKRLQEAELRRLDDLAEKYDKLRDKSTGEIGQSQIDSLNSRLGADAQQGVRQEAAQQVATILAGAQAEIDAASMRGKAALDNRLKARTDEFRAQAQAVQQAEADLERATKQYGEKDKSGTLAALRAIVEEEKAKLAELETQAQAVRDTVAKIPESLQSTQSSITRTQGLVAGLFTDQSADAFLNLVVPLVEAETKAKELREQYKELSVNAAAAANAGKMDAEQRANDAQTALANLTTQNVEVNNLRASIKTMVTQLSTMPGIPESVQKSMLDLSFYAGLTKEQVQGIAAALNALRKANTPLTGNNAGIAAAPPATGPREFRVKNNSGAESEAKKAARARLELERERIKQENALRQEGIDQQLAVEQRMFDQGLVSTESYYDSRRKLLLESNSMEIDMLQRQLKEVEKETAAAKLGSEKMRFQRQEAQLNGEIAVLEAKRKAIRDQTAEDQRRAALDYQKLQLSTVNSLYSQMINTGSMPEMYKSRLEELRLIQKDTLARMGVEMNDQLKADLDRSLQFQAYADTLTPLTVKLDLVNTKFSQFSNELQNMQTAGVLTSQEMEVAFDRAAKTTIQGLQGILKEQEAYLQTIAHLKETSPQLWDQQVQKINETRLAISNMNAELNKTAISVNKTIGDSLAEGLAKMEPTLASLKNTVLGFALSIAQTLQKEFGKSLSEKIMRSITGGDSAGGIGGWLQGILRDNNQPGTGVTPGSNPMSPMYVSEVTAGDPGIDTVGRSAVSPMYVNVVNQPVGAGANPITDAFPGVFTPGSKPSSSEKTPTVGLDAQESGSFLNSMSTSFGGIIGSLGSSIGGLFGGLGSLLTSLIGSVITAISASNAGGGLGGLLGGLFGAAHGGGTVGRLTMKRSGVSPTAFIGAARYHNGGVAGLRPNEVPTILEKGETVRTQQQEAALQAALAAGGGGMSGQMNIRNVLVMDQNEIPNAMQGSVGEKVVMAHVMKNIPTIKQSL